MTLLRGALGEYFVGAGAKTLSAVDARPSRSNQHEIGTSSQMREQFLGSDKRQFKTTYIWLNDEDDPLTAFDFSTHYDTREGQPDRSAEWRLYYPSNPVTDKMTEGDSLFLALQNNGSLLFVVTAAGSTSERQVSSLFDLWPQGTKYVSRELHSDTNLLGFAARYILETIGVEFKETDTERLDSIIEPFGKTFPTTLEFSSLARETANTISPLEDADQALLGWLDHEEAMFRRLEHKIVSDRLEEGFVTKGDVDVDGFLKFSLSVQNRRKSRMGQSLEHHMQAVFDAYGLKYERGVTTENRHRPDFLFPSLERYIEAETNAADLSMLGAKSTCKDRWRQVLAEAAKIERKHLLTLEPSISEQQTDQMKASALQLVVPKPIHDTYTATQQNWLISFSNFIEYRQNLQ